MPSTTSVVFVKAIGALSGSLLIHEFGNVWTTSRLFIWGKNMGLGPKLNGMSIWRVIVVGMVNTTDDMGCSIPWRPPINKPSHCFMLSLSHSIVVSTGVQWYIRFVKWLKNLALQPRHFPNFYEGVSQQSTELYCTLYTTQTPYMSSPTELRMRWTAYTERGLVISHNNLVRVKFIFASVHY